MAVTDMVRRGVVVTDMVRRGVIVTDMARRGVIVAGMVRRGPRSATDILAVKANKLLEIVI